MIVHVTRLVVGCALAAALSVGAPMSAVAADPTAAPGTTQAADTPTPPNTPTLDDIGPRTLAALGGPAALVPVDARTATVAPDGSVLFFDARRHQLRRVDAAGDTIDIVAGSGAAPTSAAPDTTAPATSSTLPYVEHLAVDGSGDIFARMCVTTCSFKRDIYRLDAATDRWQLALEAPFLDEFGFGDFAAKANGDLLVTDRDHGDVRLVESGDDPSTGGSVVDGTQGLGGDHLAYSSDTGLFLPAADGIRRIATSGQVTTIGQSVFHPHDRVNSLALSRNGQTVFVQIERDLQAFVYAVPVDGTAARTVAGPQPTCDPASENCIPHELASVRHGNADLVLAVESGAIRSWPADGTRPSAYERYAGIVDDARGLRSPDGTPLRQTYLDWTFDSALGPDRRIALASADGVKIFDDYSDPDSVLHTVLRGLRVQWVSYAADGTLYAQVRDGGTDASTVVAVAANGHVTAMIGGGTGDLIAHAKATDVALGESAHVALDPASKALYVNDSYGRGDDAAFVFALAPGDTTLTARAPVDSLDGVGDLAVTAPGDVLVSTANHGLRTIRPDGTFAASPCTGTSPYASIGSLPDGRVYGQGRDGVVLCGTDGSTRTWSGLHEPYVTMTSDGRLLATNEHGPNGGLFAVSDVIDSSTPSAPAATLQNAGRSVHIEVARPTTTGDNADRVILCTTIDGSPTRDPVCGANDVTAFGSANSVSFDRDVDPFDSTRFWVYTETPSGTLSPPTQLQRPGATLVGGQAVSGATYGSSGLRIDVAWNGGPAIVRYAPGTSAPPTPTSGAAAATTATANGEATSVSVNASSGERVAISLFVWTDAGLTAYRRTSFVVTSGTDSDTVSVVAPSVVSAGVRPKVFASVLGRSPSDGAKPVTGVAVTLRCRPFGATAWTRCAGGTTGRDGAVAFAVPVPSMRTQYQAVIRPRHSAADVASTNVATNVQQTVSLGAPTRTAVKKTFTVHGVVAPGRSGAIVSLQRARGRSWVTIGTARSGSTGRYVVALRWKKKGTIVVRSVASGTAALLGGVSATRRIVIR